MQNSSEVIQPSEQEKPRYYTWDYEWIDFRGSVAYVGLCPFKLTGIKEIQKIEFSKESDSKKVGEVIASIFYDDYKIDVHMPVSGKILSINNALLTGNENIVILEPESRGYIALIIPTYPLNRHGLIPTEKVSSLSKTIN
jgi:glycine cleavage system H lipoate-binding protein